MLKNDCKSGFSVFNSTILQENNLYYSSLLNLSIFLNTFLFIILFFTVMFMHLLPCLYKKKTVKIISSGHIMSQQTFIFLII